MVNTLEKVYSDLRIKQIAEEKTAFDITEELKEPSQRQEPINISFSNEGTINKNSVTIGKYTFYFSYKTIIAFDCNEGLFVCQNWSRTTGKFLNELEADKNKRLPKELFEFKLNQVLKKINA